MEFQIQITLRYLNPFRTSEKSVITCSLVCNLDEYFQFEKFYFNLDIVELHSYLEFLVLLFYYSITLLNFDMADTLIIIPEDRLKYRGEPSICKNLDEYTSSPLPPTDIFFSTISNNVHSSKQDEVHHSEEDNPAVEVRKILEDKGTIEDKDPLSDEEEDFSRYSFFSLVWKIIL